MHPGQFSQQQHALRLYTVILYSLFPILAITLVSTPTTFKVYCPVGRILVTVGVRRSLRSMNLKFIQDCLRFRRLSGPVIGFFLKYQCLAWTNQSVRVDYSLDVGPGGCGNIRGVSFPRKKRANRGRQHTLSYREPEDGHIVLAQAKTLYSINITSRTQIHAECVPGPCCRWCPP